MTIIDTRSVFWGAVKCCINERLVAFNGNVARILYMKASLKSSHSSLQFFSLKINTFLDIDEFMLY